MSDKLPFIGQMDRRITIQQEVVTQNSTGEAVATLTTIANPWAHMSEASGNEDVEGKVRHLITRTYTIRYNTTVFSLSNQLKVVDGSKTFEVYHVKELGRKQHLQLLVTDYE